MKRIKYTLIIALICHGAHLFAMKESSDQPNPTVTAWTKEATALQQSLNSALKNGTLALKAREYMNTFEQINTKHGINDPYTDLPFVFPSKGQTSIPPQELYANIENLLTTARTESKSIQEEKSTIEKLENELFNIPLENAYPQILRTLTEINIDLVRNYIKQRECTDATCKNDVKAIEKAIMEMKKQTIAYFIRVNKAQNPPITSKEALQKYQNGVRGGLTGIWNQFFVPKPHSIAGKFLGKMDLAELYMNIMNAAANPTIQDTDTFTQKIFLKELESKIDTELKRFRDNEDKYPNMSWLPRGKFTLKQIEELNKKIKALETNAIKPAYENQLINLKIEREMYARKGLSGYNNNYSAAQYLDKAKEKEELSDLQNKLLPYANTKFFGGYAVPAHDRNIRPIEPSSYEDAVINDHIRGLTYQDLQNFYAPIHELFNKWSAMANAAGKLASNTLTAVVITDTDISKIPAKLKEILYTSIPNFVSVRIPRWFGRQQKIETTKPSIEEPDLSAERAEQAFQEIEKYDLDPYNKAYEGAF